MKNQLNTRFLAITAMLAALATAIMFLELQIPIFPAFLKLDLSDVIALIAAFSLGPISGIFVELIKNLIHLTMTITGGVGEFGNFLIGVSLVVPAGLVYKYRRSFSGALTGLGAGTLSMCVIGFFVNYFMLIPVYVKLFSLDAVMEMATSAIPSIDSLFTLVLYGIVPFNLFKGVIVSVITLLLYKRIARLIKEIGKSRVKRIETR